MYYEVGFFGPLALLRRWDVISLCVKYARICYSASRTLQKRTHIYKYVVFIWTYLSYYTLYENTIISALRAVRKIDLRVQRDSKGEREGDTVYRAITDMQNDKGLRFCQFFSLHTQ